MAAMQIVLSSTGATEPPSVYQVRLHRSAVIRSMALKKVTVSIHRSIPLADLFGTGGTAIIPALEIGTPFAPEAVSGTHSNYLVVPLDSNSYYTSADIDCTYKIKDTQAIQDMYFSLEMRNVDGNTRKKFDPTISVGNVRVPFSVVLYYEYTEFK